MLAPEAAGRALRPLPHTVVAGKIRRFHKLPVHSRIDFADLSHGDDSKRGTAAARASCAIPVERRLSGNRRGKPTGFWAMSAS
jgi:hypothetical protein